MIVRQGPVSLVDGSVEVTTSDFSDSGFGMPWGIDRTWTDEMGLADNPSFGTDVNIDELPHLVLAGNSVIAVIGGQALYFDGTANGYVERFGGHEMLSGDPGSGFTLVDSVGDKIVFNGFAYGTGTNGIDHLYQRGAFKSYTDAYGNVNGDAPSF